MLILYTFQLSPNSACPSCTVITMPVFITVGLSLRILCRDLPDTSSLTERTSDNHCLRTSNDTTSIAKHPTLKSTGLRY